MRPRLQAQRRAINELESEGKLAENVMHFARVLRTAGLPIGPDRVIDAMHALEVTGIERRDDFYWTLASVFLDRYEQFQIFDQAFHIFWRDPRLLERAMAMMLPAIASRLSQEKEEAGNAVSEALRSGPQREERGADDAPAEIDLDSALTFSAIEILQRADFETMTLEEIAQAKALIASLRLPIPQICTRRYRPDPHGARVDLRATLRTSLRDGGHSIPLKKRTPRRRHPPLVVLCDISGSM
ncbi:MAG: VWA domain-containing protein, partial [Betaproteobacteria bacterium]|nr:VWA domain-containing protein [Betaproteobacteria bacterium]